MEKWWIEAQYRDRGRCVYCDFNLYENFQSYWTTQADHLIPQKVLSNPDNRPALINHDVFRGAPVDLYSFGNCVTACTFCNQLKGCWVPEKWMDMSRDEIISSNRERLKTLRIPHEIEFNRRRGKLS